MPLRADRRGEAGRKTRCLIFMNDTIHRTIHPETKILDEKKGLIEYIASDETLDHHREIIRVDGWRFNFFKKNAPFVDSHNYGTIGMTLGKVLDSRVENRRLVQTVEWAVTAGADSELIQFGWKMTVAGFLKAVSVGFIPTRAVDKWTNNGADLARVAREMGLPADTAARVCCIYLEQEQIELSACIIGANPAALAKAFKAGAIDESDVDFVAKTISAGQSAKQTASAATNGAAAAFAQEQRQAADFLRKFEQLTK